MYIIILLQNSLYKNNKKVLRQIFTQRNYSNWLTLSTWIFIINCETTYSFIKWGMGKYHTGDFNTDPGSMLLIHSILKLPHKLKGSFLILITLLYT